MENNDFLWRRADALFRGRYEYLGRLGSGGMGMVFLVQARDLGRRKYALKIISKRSPENSGVDVYAEIQILRSLRHPNIVSIYEAVEDESYVYIIQDYIDGKSLAQLRDDPAARRAISEEVVKMWMTDIADALAYVHSCNIVHRDIKPGNIMIDSDGSAILIDFGIARRLATISKTRTGSTVGSAPYSPLERLQGQADGPQTDIYAYGTTFYSLLLGKIPSVSGREINTLRTSNRSIKPYYMTAYRTMISDLDLIRDEGMRELIKDCVNIDPARRIGDFNTVRYRLKSIDQVRQVHSEKKRDYVRAKTLMTALLIAGILLAGLGIVQMKRDHDHRYDRIIAAADEAYDAGDYALSEENAVKAVEYDPGNEAGYFTRYKAMTAAAYESGSKEKYTDIINAISSDMAERPELAGSLYTASYLANAYFETEDIGKTIETLSGRDDLEDDQLMLLGHALYLSGETARAQECLDRMAGDTPQKFYLEGLINESGDQTKSIEYYTKVLDSEEASSSLGDLRRKALSQIAQLYMQREEYGQAAAVITGEMEKDAGMKNSARINMILMDCFYKAGDYGRAISQADAVNSIFPSDHAYEIKISSLELSGNYSGALQTADEWEETYPESPAPHIQRVVIYNNIAGNAKTDADRKRTYPDFISAYETESKWLRDHGYSDGEMQTLEAAYYNAINILDQIDREE